MPNSGDLPVGVGTAVAGPTACIPGDSLALFNNETVAATPQASIVMARAMSPVGSDQGTTFFIEFAAPPTDSLEILGSNNAPVANAAGVYIFNLADWYVLFTSTNKQQDYYTDTGRFAYYCAYLASQSAGGKVTVNAQR